MPRRLALAAPALALAALTHTLAAPALAQVGPPGATVGLPANPFASNYPSAPPPAYDAREAPGRRFVRRRTVRAPDGTPLPPGRIPR